MALLGVALLCSVAASAPAQEERLTKREVIERASPICADAERAMKPHLRRFNRAAERERLRAMVRHGRRMIRAARPRVRRLAALVQPGHDRYRRFVSNLRASLASLDSSFDALSAGRPRLAVRRARRAERQADRGERAGRRYGLRKPCI